MIFELDELILNTTDYDFVLFAHQGFGGRSKYLATPKRAGLPKLLVKHKGEYAPPCNGFVYGRLAQLLGITVPKTYMMDVADSDKHLFESSCVVGMEFIDGLLPIDIKRIKGNDVLEKGFIHCFLLSGLFTQFEDSMQCAFIPDLAVYPLDFDDSFGLEYPVFNAAMKESSLSEWMVKQQLENSARNNLDTYLNISIETAAKELGIPSDEVKAEFITVLRRFCVLTEEEIVSVTDTLMEFFPPLLAVYYEEYIRILQKKAEAYLFR